MKTKRTFFENLNDYKKGEESLLQNEKEGRISRLKKIKKKGRIKQQKGMTLSRYVKERNKSLKYIQIYPTRPLAYVTS